MTSDDGSSLAQAEVHDRVRHDILQGDARQLSATISRDLIDPFVHLNWAGAEPPKLSLPLPNKQDPAASGRGSPSTSADGAQSRGPRDAIQTGAGRACTGRGGAAPARILSPAPCPRRRERGRMPTSAHRGEGDEGDEVDEIEDDMLGEWETVATAASSGRPHGSSRSERLRRFGAQAGGSPARFGQALAKGLRAANMIARAKGDGSDPCPRSPSIQRLLRKSAITLSGRGIAPSFDFREVWQEEHALLVHGRQSN